MTECTSKKNPAGMRFEPGSDQNHIVLTGRLDSHTVPDLWKDVGTIESRIHSKPLVIDMNEVSFCDGAGFALVFFLETTARKHKADCRIIHIRPDLNELVERFDQARLAGVLTTHPEDTNAITEIGRAVSLLCEDINLLISYLGRMLSAFIWTAAHSSRIRWNDFFKLIDLVGVNAVGICLLLGFLFGLIMAFSAAMPLRQFGVEIYVSDLVAIALIRVLGPFITAIIIAGRTGSSFAAELGTMKINNELDALHVMSLDPMRFLVVPRVASAILMAPLLTVLTNLAGLAGSALVITSLGYGFGTYCDHVQGILDVTDVFVGLTKALVYGGLVGGIGCIRGLQTETGAGAVGISTTRAVVSGIVLIVMAEGLFSVLLYFLGI